MWTASGYPRRGRISGEEMMGNPEQKSAARHALQEFALPVAPMAMPEQMLSRRSRSILLLRPLFQWFALR